ncbi:protein asteroid-like [Nomia melanderi]|uniref:protein asteroid-like n=1 Tax=Nomia melanderi TaxID=2448451 RepID=UPI003FCD6781
MGIRGLTAILNKSPCLRPYNLQNTFLVIDGDNLSHNIYISCTDDSWIYGGAYDAYAEIVSKFFDKLLECNVTPLVLMDGSYEDSKLNTVISRLHQKLQIASTIIEKKRLGCRMFAPPLRMNVFIQVLREKNIKHVRCLIEADRVAAAIANALNCPVLSDDSDFYLYGTLCIPFNTLNHTVKRDTAGNALSCKIFQFDYFLNHFPRLNEYTFSLIAVLLGNDVSKQDAFKNFLFKFRTYKGVAYAESIFNWLRNHTLEQGITKIMITIPKSERQKCLNIIEENINHYRCLPPVHEYIMLLDASKYIVNCAGNSTKEAYKFAGDIQSLPYTGSEEENFELCRVNKKENHINQLINTLIEHKKANRSNESMIDTLPKWFLEDFRMVKFAGNFLTLIDTRWNLTPIVIDNFQCPSSHLIAFDILKVTFGILTSATDEKRTSLKCVVRDQHGWLMHHDLEAAVTIPLSKLKDLPLNDRKEILDNALGIRNVKCIDELPSKWKLYVACFKYWTDRAPHYKSNRCYTYPIIFSMLFNIIITKIGQYESLKSLGESYVSLLSAEIRNISSFQPHYFKHHTIDKAYDKINMLDCLLAAPFFLIHAKPQPIEFLDRHVLHAFAEFQNCLLLSVELNALLSRPYEEVNIATLYNGPLLYNLYVHFSKRTDLDDYLNGIMNSMPLLSIFNLLLTTLNFLFE